MRRRLRSASGLAARALGQARPSAMTPDGRVRLVVHRQTFLALCDRCVLSVLSAQERGKRLLPDVMPLQDIDLRDFHRLLQSDITADEIERQILPARTPPAITMR